MSEVPTSAGFPRDVHDKRIGAKSAQDELDSVPSSLDAPHLLGLEIVEANHFEPRLARSEIRESTPTHDEGPVLGAVSSHRSTA